MCFYNDDDDWVATTNEQYCQRATRERKCIECGRLIGVGEWHIDIWQQEYEECQICEDVESGDYDEEQDSSVCEHDFGESFSGAICRQCGLILAAIYDLEGKEGCPEHARQPGYSELRKELWGDHRQQDGHYEAHAVKMFPELLGCRMFNWTPSWNKS